MKRIVVLLRVVVLMMVVMATSVAPAFAVGGWVAHQKIDPITGNTDDVYCRTGDRPLYTVGEGQEIVAADRNSNRWVCISDGTKARPYDDRIF
jgi:hypothetical protein